MEAPEAQALRLVDLDHAAFRIQADAALVEAGGAEFARSVVRYLEDARGALATLLRVVPAEPTGVVLYGRGAYLNEHGPRFSFRTVGFFDGRIHVVSRAHPAGELRALLFHEYTHALFREREGNSRTRIRSMRRRRGLRRRHHRQQQQQRDQSGHASLRTLIETRAITTTK